ncbi:MAG: hypothetical protein GEU83_09520 [Pseudonocardiaceae bacterium]|nr:hypothetical protein [Pseudonocardiaceae bacterium]
MAMTLRLTETETDDLRRQAEIEHRSMQDLAREAVREYVSRRAHKSRMRASSEFGAAHYAEALDRLGKL